MSNFISADSNVNQVGQQRNSNNSKTQGGVIVPGMEPSLNKSQSRGASRSNYNNQ